MAVYIPRHIGVNIRQHMGSPSDQCHVQAALDQVLCHFQPDKAASDDDGLLWLFHHYIFFDPNCVRNGTKCENPFIVLRDKCRNVCRGTRCDYQIVIGFQSFHSAVQVSNRHGFCSSINFYRLCPGTHVYCESGIERRRSL